MPALLAPLDARLRLCRRWLLKHDNLLRSLDLNVQGEALAQCDFASALRKAAALAATAAAAAAAAAAATKPLGTALTDNTPADVSSSSTSSSSLLQLQSFRRPLDALLLQQLPAQSLTSLVIIDDYDDATQDLQKAAAVRRSLSHLVNLRRLVLIEDCEDEPTNTNLLVPAPAGMQQLTILDIGIHRGRQEELCHLPALLLQLSIGAGSNGFEEPDENWDRPLGSLLLGHLTSLTKLSLRREVSEELLPMDVLPPSLVELDCCWVPSAEPLLHLKRLRLLSMGEQMPAAELQRLGSSLTALQAVALEYSTPSDAAAAAAGWSCLPVTSLHVAVEQDFDLACLQHIATLTRLTALHMRIGGHGSPPVAWSGRELAAVLAPLKQLQALVLHGFGLHMPDDVPRTEHAWQIAQALAGLPHMQSLKLATIPFGRQVAPVLSGMSQLTSLKLPGCSLVDYDVNVLALRLTALQELQVSYTADVSDGVLPVIAHNLQQLSSLQLMHTGVSDVGLQWVRGMQRLRILGVCSKLISSPALAGIDADVDRHACVLCGGA
jgi:hypothetical protein